MPLPSHPDYDVVPNGNLVIRFAWYTLGWVSLALGAIGVFLPLLPTTPFVILAAFAFARSSPRLHARLLDSKLFGPAIRDWRANGAIAMRYKVAALVMMAAAFIGAVIASVPAYALVLQVLCMAGAATFILTRPSQGRADAQPSGDKDEVADYAAASRTGTVAGTEPLHHTP